MAVRKGERPVEKASDYHRDIYVGMVAEELSQAGYFGEVFRLYGYLLWQEGQAQMVCAARETDCAAAYLQHWQAGALLSPYLSCGQHLADGDGAEQRLAVQDQLEQTLRRTYEASLRQQAAAEASRLSQPEIVQTAERYWQSLSKEAQARQQELFAAMLRQLAGRGYVARQAAEALLAQLSTLPKAEPAESERQQWAGYAWLDEQGVCHYYGNAYLPQALQKWLTARAEGGLVSGLLTGCVSRRERFSRPLRERWQEALTLTFDPAYWAMRQEIASLCRLNKKG